MKDDDVTEKIIGCAYTVHNKLGPGFIEKVYEKVKRHEVQLVNYLAATNIDCGLLLNFGASVEVKRKFREYKPKAPLLSSIL